MTPNSLHFLVLALFPCIKCELSLKIIKCTEDNLTPISNVVEEKAGANFTLLCDLVSSETDSNYYDFQVSWIKQSNDLRFWREHDYEDGKNTKKIYSILSSSEMNKAVKTFAPLKPEDEGKYICVSLKYNLFQSVDIFVRTEKPHYEDHPYIQETIFCSKQMFKCSNGVCIIHHYICDGKADCKDGSDESEETCHGDPCDGKISCEDGRCIPNSWCCDRHLDPNCTVTNPPKCCQSLSESYEGLESGSSTLHQSTTTLHQSDNGARYLFISICILSVFFVIVLLLLILTRVAIFAKKSSLQQSRNVPSNIENIALRNQSLLLRNCDSFSYRTPHNDLIIDNCDVSDPLLFPRGEEQPPPYIDVVLAQNCRLNLNEPPPPYTSQEGLDAGRDGGGVAI